MDFINKSWNPLEIQAEQMRYSTAVVGTGVAVVLTLVLIYSTKARRQKSDYFKDGDGESIKELKKNTRFTRFTESHELSEEGKELAGDDPYIIRNGKFRELVISTPDQLRDFYRKDTKYHPKPKNLNMGEYFGRLLGQCVGAQGGQRWKIIRNHFDPEFSHQAITKAIPTFSKEIDQWCDGLAKDSTHVPSAAGGFVRNAVQAFKLLPFRIVVLMLYGEVFNERMYSKLLELHSLHKRIIEDVAMGERMISRWFNSVPSAEKRRMDNYQREWETFNLDIIRYAREHNLDCPTERIFRGVDQGGQMNKTEFVQTVDEILFGNVDVSASVLNTLLINLAANRSFQDALRAEITEQKSQKSYSVTQYIAKQSSLLNYLVMESMRLSPAFWFSLPECTAVDKVIGKYRIPGQTATVIDVRRLNTGRITWGTDGEVFRPQRFANMPISQCQYAMMRFGAGGGSGKCLGKHVADVVFKLTTLAVMERYVISPANIIEEKGGQSTAITNSEIEFTRV